MFMAKKLQTLKDNNKPLESVDQVVQFIFREQSRISKDLAAISEWNPGFNAMHLQSNSTKTNSSQGHRDQDNKRKERSWVDNSKNSKRASGDTKSGGGKGAGKGDSHPKLCYGCGRDNHLRDECFFDKHPDFNENGSWADSTKGKKYKSAGLDCLAWGKKLEGDNLVNFNYSRPQPPKKTDGKFNTSRLRRSHEIDMRTGLRELSEEENEWLSEQAKFSEWLYEQSKIPEELEELEELRVNRLFSLSEDQSRLEETPKPRMILMQKKTKDNSDLITISITPHSRIRQVRRAAKAANEENLMGRCLLDTGATAANYVSLSFAQELEKLGYVTKQIKPTTVSGVFDIEDAGAVVDKTINFFLTCKSEKNEILIIALEARIAPIKKDRFDYRTSRH
jgi:hypothetical protein